MFEHSLRIRLKAEASGDGTTSIPSEPISKAVSLMSAEENGDETAEGEHSTRDENESASTRDSTVVGSSRVASESTETTIKGKGKATPENAQAQPDKKTGGETENLIGKINSFITSDLGNILEGSEFVSFGMAYVHSMTSLIICLVFHVPVQIILSSVFLYKILGWR